MDSSMEWKEAQGSSEEFVDTNDEVLDQSSVNNDNDNDIEDKYQPIQGTSSNVYRQDTTPFSLQSLNLRLLRNISALSDAAQHRSKLHYAKESSETFDSWLQHAIVTISPNADVILFADQTCDKEVYLARLKLEPIDQYVIKKLSIPLDYDEEITCMLCLSIMSTQKTSLGSVDWNVLVIGVSSGYVKFYTEQSNCLLTLKFCEEPVVDVRCQTQRFPCNAKSQAHFASIVDEMIIIYRSAAIVVDGIGMYENLRLAKADILANSSDYDPSYNLTNLPTILTCQKWSIETSRVISGDLLGVRCTNRFDSLRSSSIDTSHVPSKANARTIAIVGSDPFISCYRESKESTAPSYKEMITSLLPFWSKTQQTRLQLNEIEASSNICLFDKGRVATSFVASPDKRLAIITDNFGRVLLVDVTNWIVVRIWKGYRDAECGWIEAKKNTEPNSSQDSPSAFFVVIYAPKRGLLEIWLAQRGPRVAAFNVGKGCILLYCGYKMLNMRADSMSKSNCNINSSHCFLLNAKSETLFVVDVPYSYSLHKESDQKSRDSLLIEELLHAIQQDLEVCAISEVLHRIEMTESLETAINHIATGLSPKKIVNILENLINKIMTTYNNHSGQGLSVDDRSILELCRRIIRLCSLFEELSKSPPNDLTLPEVNQRLIEQYEEHPDEIDDFSEKLNWSSSEVLRYLSLLSLERSFRINRGGKENPWPNLGEPLSWQEMISCFDLKRLISKSSTEHNLEKLSIKLKNFNGEFLRQDQILKTAIFLYNRLSETYFRSPTTGFVKEKSDQQHSTYSYIEPSSRLALLFQFWLSTSLCNHWKMWAFLQEQVGQMSDELKVLVMTHEDDQVIVDTWKQIYQLILESDNHFAAMIATNVIKNDTLRMIEDNQKTEKLRENTNEEGEEEHLDSGPHPSVDWECLCIDAERMSMLGQQLEDVFLLELLLKYSPNVGTSVSNFQYKLSRRTVASLLRAGPAIVSELIAQWAAQTDVSLKIFTQPYGIQPTEESDQISIATGRQNISRRRLTPVDHSSKLSGEEHSKELLHHIKTSFPCSLNPDIVLLNCVWEFCHRWTNAIGATAKAKMLKKCRDALDLLSDVRLRHSVSGLAFKTFFQRTFERFVWLVETNATMLSAKSWRTRDNLTRKDLNMSEDCLQDFVDFCCDLTELMMQTNSDTPNMPVSDDPVELPQQQQIASDKNLDTDKEIFELNERLLEIDEWWSTPNMDAAAGQQHQVGSADACSAMGDDDGKQCPGSSSGGCEAITEELLANQVQRQNLLATIALSKSSVDRFDVDTLIDLNRLANMMNLALRLNIVRPYPLTLIGEESRKQLKLDLLQSPKSGADIRIRMGSLDDLRHKFARRCILGIVANMIDESMMEVSPGGLTKDIDIIRQATGITQKKSMGSSDQQSISSTTTTRTMAANEKTISKETIDKANRRNDWSDSDSNNGDDADDHKNNNDLMLMFAKLLSLASEWQLDLDELQMELVFELYRNNYDRIAAQISTRVRDTKTLATGLLKIASQRILILFGLSPHLSSETSWKDRADKWSLFAPNVGQWLRSIQHEEMRRELASLIFSDSLKPDVESGGSKTSTVSKQRPDDEMAAEISLELSFGLQLFVLKTLRHRTKLLLESITNHLDGQAGRLAYDLLQLLESQVFDTFLAETLAQVS